MFIVGFHLLAEQALGRENIQLKSVSQNYENDKKLWVAAISNLEQKIKVNIFLFMKYHNSR
jgi:hypothetical protein